MEGKIKVYVAHLYCCLWWLAPGIETLAEPFWRRNDNKVVPERKYLQATKSKYFTTFNRGHGMFKVKMKINLLIYMAPSVDWLVPDKEKSNETLWRRSHHKMVDHRIKEWLSITNWLFSMYVTVRHEIHRLFTGQPRYANRVMHLWPQSMYASLESLGMKMWRWNAFHG